MTEAEAVLDDADEDSPEPPQPARCGCCRQPVDVIRTPGRPEMHRGHMTKFYVCRLRWNCKCNEARRRCVLCHRCEDHCGCGGNFVYEEF